MDTGLLLPVVAVLAGGLVHGALGIGFPLVATPLLALGADMRTAILMTLLPTIAVNLLSIARGGGWSLSIGRYWPVAVWVLIGSVAGTQLLMRVDPLPFKFALAAAIVLYLASSAARPGAWRRLQDWPRASGAVTGLAAGGMAGTVNIAVPVLIIYFGELGLGVTALVQVLNMCFLAGKTAQLATFAVLDALPATWLLQTLPLALLALAATWWAARWRDRIDAASYRRWLRRLLAVMAVVLCAQGIHGVLQA